MKTAFVKFLSLSFRGLVPTVQQYTCTAVHRGRVRAGVSVGGGADWGDAVGLGVRRQKAHQGCLLLLAHTGHNFGSELENFPGINPRAGW